MFSKGGYVAVPVAFAARSLKIPVVTHESDLSAGLANKLIAPRADKVLTAFPETAGQFANGEYAGLPLSDDLFDTDKKPRSRVTVSTAKNPCCWCSAARRAAGRSTPA